MINSVSANSISTIDSGKRNVQTLSDEQQALVTNTLSAFEAENLSEQDAQAIVGVFEEAGITPSKALTELIHDAGFEPQAIAELAGIEPPDMQGRRPPPPELSASSEQVAQLNLSATELEELNSLLAQFSDGDHSEEARVALLDTIKATLVQAAPEHGLINTSV